MSLQDRLVCESGKLTPAEQRAATVLLQDSREVLFLSATEVAARARVHESTVIRLARKLGYDGYAALRNEVRSEAQRGGAANRSRYQGRREYQLEKLVQDEALALLGMIETIDQDRLDDLARTLIKAGRIYIHGAPILVASMEKRLRRLGLDVAALPSEGWDLPEVAMTIDKGDVFMAFVLKEAQLPLQQLAKHAELRGADIVVVSDAPGVRLSVVPKHLILALRGADSTFRTLTVPIVFGYALELSIYRLAQTATAASLDRLADLTSLLDVPDAATPSARVTH